jgi:hydroxyacylglutathione hydrolase
MVLFHTFFFADTNEVNTYMIGCSQTREVFLIDAGSDSPLYDHFLQENNARLTGILLTHFHWDHDQALDEIVSRFDVPVYSMTGNTPNGKQVTEGDSLPIGNLKNRLCITTGHTPDSLTLVVMNRIAFVGDAIFAGSIGGTPSEEKKQELKSHIRNKIFTLPDDTLLCSGHGPLTTVGIEKQWNPLMQD